MLNGSYVALITPFKNNEIDFDALENLIEFQIEEGTDGILLLGTTAETPALSLAEREQLLEFAIARINRRVPVMVGTGCNNLDTTIAATRQAAQLGADYALVVTPYYNKPTQSGLLQYFKAVHDATDINLVIYNVPGRTGCNMHAETTTVLANNFARIVGIKEASGDLVQASHIIRDTLPNFYLLSGEDALNWPLLACGASGVVSVTANIAPAMVKRQVSLAAEGDIKRAAKLHTRLLELHQAMFTCTNPIPVKQALALMGKCTPQVRLPLYPMSEDERKQLADTLTRYELT